MFVFSWERLALVVLAMAAAVITKHLLLWEREQLVIDFVMLFVLLLARASRKTRRR